MTIIAYTGLPGHGKSYSVVENVIVPALKTGRVVAHNLELNHAALAVVCEKTTDEISSLLVQIPKNDTTPDELIALCPAGSVSVIDEIWRYWGAGLKASEVPKPQLAYFKEHRHRVGADGKSSEIVIIDQELGSGVARFIRDLVELTYIHEKHTKLGLTKSFRVDIYSRAMEASKASHKSGKFIRSMQGKYSSLYWNCYISHTQNTEKNLGEAGLENIADDRGNLLKGWTVKSAIIALVLLPFAIYAGMVSVNGMVQHGGMKKEAQPKPIPLTQPSPQAIQPLPASTGKNNLPPANALQVQATPAPAVDQPSTIWRIVGVVWKPDGDGIALLASGTGKRRLDLKQYCKRTPEEAQDWTCHVEGQWVTAWTGTNLGGATNAALVPGSATAQ